MRIILNKVRGCGFGIEMFGSLYRWEEVRSGGGCGVARIEEEMWHVLRASHARVACHSVPLFSDTLDFCPHTPV
ncbi:hypothetical protein TorRG33x02_117590 [Trema orientale]|uniref:Uncharacterized protein n=1 Tax=Trema orientale TaxID=63057 RepID=A0A2P5F3Q7_TREOI|nr:hypothetical protein TorRG33x02_117590 [Trema orientale]